MEKFAVLMLLTAFSGWLGAVLSKAVKDGASPLLYIAIAGWMAPATWAFVAKYSPYNMMVSSTLWTLFYELPWFIMMIFFYHEYNGLTQVAGASLIMLGIILMSL